MITQQLWVNEDMSGTLTIRAGEGQVGELIALAEELQNRPGVQTDGFIYELPPSPPPAE